MRKDELAGKTSLAEQTSSSGTHKKNRVYDLWKKRQEIQETAKMCSNAGSKLEGSKLS